MRNYRRDLIQTIFPFELSRKVALGQVLRLKSQSEEQTRSHFLHLAGAQRGDQRADFCLRNGLKMVEVDSAISGHAVCVRQQKVGGTCSDSQSVNSPRLTGLRL